MAVVVNTNSTNSVQLGNYYCERRQVPPQNLLGANWTGSSITWAKTNFESVLLNPLLSMLASRKLTNQIDYVVLSMDFPYHVTETNGENATTAALFYGFKADGAPPCGGCPNSCSLPNASSNSYAGSEGIFRSTPPINASSNSFLVTMITASNLASAKLIVDQGVLGDFTFPTQTVFLAKSTNSINSARNIRYKTFDNAIFNGRLRGNYSIQRTNTEYNWVFGNCLGVQHGVLYSGTDGTTFVPGAMADNLTSFGGLILEDSFGHLKLLAYLAAGASASYGTVIEPCNYLEKFPSPQNYFYQARGFSLGECYYQSVTNPFQGLLVGEPLAAPFAQPASGSWNNLPANALLVGTTNLAVQFTASDAQHPLQQIDLFLDGAWVQTLTNLPPTRSNLLNVTINGQSMNYLVPLGASIKTVAGGLASVLNTSANTNVTKSLAYANGDRIELRCFDRTKKGAQLVTSTSSSIGTGTGLTTWIASSRANYLDTIANGIRAFQITGAPANGNYLQVVITKTNSSVVTVAVTNNSGLNLPQLTQQLLDAVNGSAALQGADGVTGEDLVTTGYDAGGNPLQVQFNFRARSLGWDAAQVQVDLNGSVALALAPSTAVKLDENLPDLEPRNHLYITAGLANLPFTFAFNTTTQADGFHQLALVVYEGSHVRTQTRLAQDIRIQNSALSATFTTLVGGSNSALEATLQFSVVANTNNISKIELFSTGGTQGSVAGQSNVIFSVFGTNLGLGLHPFYAIVTANSGKQYRTDTKWIRLIGAETPFVLSITNPPPTIAWTATAGRRYEILSATDIINGFVLRDTITASNTSARWSEPSVGPPRRFYRVRTAL